MDQTEHFIERRDASRDDQLFTKLVAHSPDVMFRLDRALRFIYVNPAVKHWTGFDACVFHGKTGLEAGLREDVWQLLVQQCSIAFDTGANTHVEFSDDTPQGARRFTARFIPEFDNSRHVKTLLGIVTDITDHWRACAELSERDEMLALAEAAGNMGRCEWLVQTGEMRLSTRMQAIFGVSSFDGRQDSWMGLVHTDDVKRIQSIIAAVFECHESMYSLQYRVVWPDGGIHWLEGHYRVTYDAEGCPWRVAGQNTDITTRKAAEHSLIEVNENLRQMSLNQARLLEEERNRIARNLHDGVGQLLYLAGIQLSSAMKTAAGEPLRATLDEVIGVIGQATRDIRSIEFELSPPELRQFGLLPALTWLAEEMERQYGLRVTIAHDDLDKPLDAFMNGVLYRAVRELLINVVKHAGVDAAYVDIRRTADAVEIAVGDAGVGMDDQHGFKSCGTMGLRSMRETLVSAGGDILMTRPAAGGTVVTLTVPLLTGAATDAASSASSDQEKTMQQVTK